MHNWRGYRENRYVGDSIHIDEITIPGACLKVLLHALAIEYGKSHRPIDVLVVAGANDILKGLSLAEVTQR